MKRILITGGSGLLGSNLALRLRKKYEIFVMVNNKKIIIPHTKTNISSNCVEKIFLSFNPDLVINTVAITDIELCESHPHLAINTNVNFLDNIISKCLKYNSKLIHISTDHLFNGIHPMMKEDDDLFPVNQYAKTKLLGENLIMRRMNDYLIIRTNFFGWGPKYRNSFSDRIIDSLSKNEKIYLFKDAFFSPVSIYNLINIIMKLYQKNAFGIFNVSSNDRISKFDFGILLSETFKFNNKLIMPNNIVNQQELTVRPKDTSIDNTRVSNYLNFNCGTVIENINHLFIDIKDGIKSDIMKL